MPTEDFCAERHDGQNRRLGEDPFCTSSDLIASGPKHFKSQDGVRRYRAGDLSFDRRTPYQRARLKDASYRCIARKRFRLLSVSPYRLFGRREVIEESPIHY